MEPGSKEKAVVVKTMTDAARGPASATLLTVRADSFSLEVDEECPMAVFRSGGRVVLAIPESRYLGHWGLDEEECL